ncbi:MAG TPA: phosphoribosyltransferase family protein [Thermodesulfovibrionales bacterium]|nr:phosphoribosyltransferase family protein [Thermodesulfovibrionales bacterium]
MERLIEDSGLRDRSYVFESRSAAGRLLAERLKKYGAGGLILAIPSGGVPVAAEIARALSLQMDVIVVRKLQIPDNPEAGFGAMGPDGAVIVNEELLGHLRLTEEAVQAQIEKTRAVILKRVELFRGGRPFPSCGNRVVILVDDGLASGYTMLAALRSLKKERPSRVVVAIPTGSERTLKRILREADEVVCLNVRSGFSFAVADAYRKWYDLTDGEVLTILRGQHIIT